MSEKEYFEDIICARATPPGASALAIIRVSGKNSWKSLSDIFKTAGGSVLFETHKAYYGEIHDDGKKIDGPLIITFSDGKGFTGEESFEINSHGSEVIVSLIIRLLVSHGARIAEPGEFSKRAFLNGMIDLTEAEAIMDLVHSSSDRSAMMALRQLSGRLSKEINNIKEKLAVLLSKIEVDIDYPEEDLSVDENEWLSDISEINVHFDELIKSYKRGRYFREEARAVILGKTNSGKSTLFNFLLNEDKAIVSDIHGTTRDYLDGLINVNGYGVRIYDTAGLRESNDPIEKEGTKRAIELAETTDLIVYVISAEDGLTTDDLSNLKKISDKKKIILVINKTDLTTDQASALEKKIHEQLSKLLEKYRTARLSALNNTGLEEFNDALIELLTDEKALDTEDPLITNERHAVLLNDARNNMINTGDKINEGLLDLAAFEVREALDRLGEITGEITPEDIIQRIFSEFCVGK